MQQINVNGQTLSEIATIAVLLAAAKSRPQPN